VLNTVHKRLALDKGVLPNGEIVSSDNMDAVFFLAEKAGDAIGKAAQAKPTEAWDIFRNGTDEEFIVLVNQIDECGDEFQTDAAWREVMQIAKRRGAAEVLEEVRVSFGTLFDRFWNETEPVTKAQTFSQVMQRTGA